MVVLGEGAVSYERGTPVVFRARGRQALVEGSAPGHNCEVQTQYVSLKVFRGANETLYRGTSLIRNSPPPLGPP